MKHCIEQAATGSLSPIESSAKAQDHPIACADLIWSLLSSPLASALAEMQDASQWNENPAAQTPATMDRHMVRFGARFLRMVRTAGLELPRAGRSWLPLSLEPRRIGLRRSEGSRWNVAALSNPMGSVAFARGTVRAGVGN